MDYNNLIVGQWRKWRDREATQNPFEVLNQTHPDKDEFEIRYYSESRTFPVEGLKLFKESTVVEDPLDTPPTKKLKLRAELLQEAEKIVTQDRNNSYGEPDQDFQRIAKLWSGIINYEFSGHEVALMMICLKLSRLTWNVIHKDSWLDIAGYAACGFETAILQEKRKETNED